MITLNLTDIYEIHAAKLDLPVSEVEFDAPQRNGKIERIYIRLSPHPDKYLPDVYNLALGPLSANGEINDKIRLKHADPGKVLSTTIFIAYAFLLEYPEHFIGLDGSNDLRANLYHGMFLANRKHLSEYFVAIGVDWYVKLLRNGDVERRRDQSYLFKPRPEPFDYSRSRHDLYRYYMFYLKK